MQFSTNPNKAIKIESFEEFQATSAAVEATSSEHELVQHLRSIGRQHFSVYSGHFIPTVLVDTKIETIDRSGTIEHETNLEADFASVAYNALQKLVRSNDPHYAPVVRYMLEHAEYVDGPLQEADRAEPVAVLRDPIARG